MALKFKLGSTGSQETKRILDRTFDIANQYAGELSIEVLPIESVEIDPENKRELALTLHDAINGIQENDPLCAQKKNDWSSLETLAKTIRDDQLINPIYVYRHGNKCRLIAGERRTLASGIAGKKEILARVAAQRPSGTKLRVLQWIENNERSDLDLSERIASIESIASEYFSEINETYNKQQITVKMLQDLTGMSKTHARRYVMILNCKSEIREAINNRKLNNINLLDHILTAKTPEHQELLLDAALSGKTFDAVVQLKRDLDSALKVTEKKKRGGGPKKQNISLGRVKPSVAKLIVNSLMKSDFFNAKIQENLLDLTNNINWTDLYAVEDVFKKLIEILDNGDNSKS